MKDWNEIKAWRKAQRKELIERRSKLDAALRRRWNERMTTLLEQAFPSLAGRVVGFCWPFKGEFDARFAVRYWRDRGATAALPEVVAKGQPLRFRKWWPGAPTTPGVYDIPVPAGTEIVVEGYQAKDGSSKAVGRNIVFADGRKFFLGLSEAEGAPK